MSLLAAAVPLAILVLAWDETAPAVRALMDATDAPASTLDSIVVLVPAETGEPTQEEFLPLEVESVQPQEADESTHPSAEAEPTEQATVLPPSEVSTVLDLLPTASVATIAPPLDTAEAPFLPAPEPTALPMALAPLAWQEVRVLRLSSFDLPELMGLSHQALPRPIWQSSVVAPTAPYLGSQPETTSSKLDGHTGFQAKTTDATSSQDSNQPEVAHLAVPAEESASLTPTPSAVALPAHLPPAPAPDYLLTESLLPALDAEADLASITSNELAIDDKAPTEAPLAEAPSHAQADWSDALASLRTPHSLEEPALAPAVEGTAADSATAGEGAVLAAEPTTQQLLSQPFEAPDLNFQVIQYARFAVPVALAQEPFAAIYAPAWPTWLAAQELRHRTRRPLVLHVATLAAAEDQSLETATGWQAELQRQALQRADLILAETPELTRRLRHDLGFSPELVRTVPAADAASVAQALRTAHVRISGGAA